MPAVPLVFAARGITRPCASMGMPDRSPDFIRRSTTYRPGLRRARFKLKARRVKLSVGDGAARSECPASPGVGPRKVLKQQPELLGGGIV